jgi:predicted O-methyltransferase YrrM
MKLFIPTTGNLHILKRALWSLGEHNKNAIIIDNSIYGLPDLGNKVMRPSVPLTFVQTMNWIQKLAWDDDLFFFMHDDAYFTDESAFSDFARHASACDRNWGVIYTLYDSCCAMNMRAVKQVGNWDVGFNQYFADDDYYHRIRIAGYETFDDDMIHGRIVHEASTTLQDPYHRVRTDHDSAGKYYKTKWGGLPHQERFRLPFDGKVRSHWLDLIKRSEEYTRLSAAFSTCEGNLLEVTDDTTAVPQIEAMEGFLRMARPSNRPIRVLETGTNKGMFGLLLSRWGGGELWTHDCDPRTKEVAKIMTENLRNIDLHYHHGPSEEGLKLLEDVGYFDLFWVDGGHDYEVCVSDLNHAKRLKVPIVVIDDGNMDTVDKAINDVLVDSEYVEIPNGLKDLDHRKMRGFRRRTHI